MKTKKKMENAYNLTQTIVDAPAGIHVGTLTNGLRNLFTQVTEKITTTFIQPRKVVVVGTGHIGATLAKILSNKKASGYKFLGFFENEITNPTLASQVKGNLDDLKAYCLKEGVDEIYFTLSNVPKFLVADLAKFAEDNFIYFRVSGQNRKSEISMTYFNEIPVMSIQKHPLVSRLNRGFKRAFDIVFSLGVLAILVPFVFPIIALAIKLESRGPIFFVQKRPGHKNQLFPCLKFRSMTVNNAGHVQAKKNDARITKVGAFLRKTSLDELPQFINVLVGDMSVVGPRPNMQSQLEFYSQHIDNYSVRHFVKPGITGHAQVNGFRGETQTIDLMEKRVELDIQYINNWNLFWDMKIVFLTAYNIIKGEENAY
jgi:putative colanic acid biosysnthesis UDP-glucose lipid carrier transferase